MKHLNEEGVDVPRLTWPPARNVVEFLDATHSLPHKAAALQAQIHCQVHCSRRPVAQECVPFSYRRLALLLGGEGWGVMWHMAQASPRPAAISMSTHGLALSRVQTSLGSFTLRPGLTQIAGEILRPLPALLQPPASLSQFLPAAT